MDYSREKVRHDGFMKSYSLQSDFDGIGVNDMSRGEEMSQRAQLIS